MQVSVLIPYFNNSDTIEKTIQSCLLQEEEFLKEIIVVDDKSEKSEYEFLLSLKAKYKVLKVYQNTGKGGNSARNFAFSNSSGNFIQWLDADDILLEGKLKTQTEFLHKNKQFDIVYSDWRYDFYENKQFTHSEKHQGAQYSDYIYQLLVDNWQPCHNYLLRRETAQKLFESGFWNIQTKVAQDREYFTAAAILGAKFGYTKGEFAVYNRWGGNTNVSTISFKKRLELNLEQVYLYKNLIGKSAIIPEKDKKTYQKILDTEIIVSCFYHPRLKIRESIPIKNIIWKRIHWKMRFFIPFIYLCSLFKQKATETQSN